MIANAPASVVWLLAGLGLLGMELLCPGVFMMWLGLAALANGLVLLVTDISFGTQVGIYAVFAAISLGIGLKLRRPPAPGLNTQQAGLIGRSVVALSFAGTEGRVRLGDSDWSARVASGNTPPEPGTRLRVDGVDGTVLVVRPES